MSEAPLYCSLSAGGGHTAAILISKGRKHFGSVHPLRMTSQLLQPALSNSSQHTVLVQIRHPNTLTQDPSS